MELKKIVKMIRLKKLYQTKIKKEIVKETKNGTELIEVQEK